MSTPVADQNVSLALARFIANTRFEHLNQQALRQTRYALLDAVGVSIAATTLGEGVNTFVEWVNEQQAQGQCKVLGHAFLTSASLAAFANGALAHALDFEDAHDQALVHPNAAVIPAVLAIAQCQNQSQVLSNALSQEKVSAKQLLTAIAVGCEITCRLGYAAAELFDQYGWYPPPIFSAYGATAAAAKLLNLNEQQILDAFSLTLSQATCSAEIKHNPQSQVRAIRDAFPAQAGVVSAQLAAKGLSGFSQPLEGKDGFFAGFSRGQYDPVALTAGLGETFAIADISFKPWPSCRGTHIPIELVLDLCRDNKLASADIEAITVYSNSLNRMLAEPIASKRAPTTAIDGKFSIPFCVAAAVIDGNVDLNSFAAQSLSKPAVLALASKVSYRVDTSYNSPLMARVELLLRDGRTLLAEASNAMGCPARGLTKAMLIGKFTHCLGHSKKTSNHDNASQLADIICHLDQQDQLGPFFELL